MHEAAGSEDVVHIHGKLFESLAENKSTSAV
jgi:NAD-dependent SIR2 family protein deacetylase